MMNFPKIERVSPMLLGFFTLLRLRFFKEGGDPWEGIHSKLQSKWIYIKVAVTHSISSRKSEYPSIDETLRSIQKSIERLVRDVEDLKKDKSSATIEQRLDINHKLEMEEEEDKVEEDIIDPHEEALRQEA
ncbi:hypothetical protein M9H77_30392 [Catharanthus roseus]|uniref:Uncharacterized protein n=1 Tax=Catharanthus roseus TaxID=4058 RepID=A0ACB9ZY65_CATRO|nr:hypothetical protein M9H77_30392 [Catharanthus roseus]